jgi:CRP-like cAMP-binding protein
MPTNGRASSISTDILASRFGKLTPLGDHERNILRLIEGRARHSHNADTKLIAEGRSFRAPHFIVTGWACRMRELKDGRRQILSLLLPGDAIGLSQRPNAVSPATITALTQLRTVDAAETAVAWRDRERVPGLAAAFDLAAAEEDFFTLGQVMRLGRQNAYERMAHLFMELDYRLSARGLVTNDSFPMPLTQETFADAVGLSVVHVNRTLQQMRREDRIELGHGRLTILDRAALTAAGEFTPPVLTAPRADGAGLRGPAGPAHPV